MSQLIEITKCPCEIPAGVRTFRCVELNRNMHTSHAARCRWDMKFRNYWRNALTGEQWTAAIEAARGNNKSCKLAAERLAEETGDPTIVAKAGHYAIALARWAAVWPPFPTRTQEAIEQIYTEHCLLCEFHDDKTDVCRMCHCNVLTTGVAMRNKLAMETEHCAMGKW